MKLLKQAREAEQRVSDSAWHEDAQGRTPLPGVVEGLAVTGTVTSQMRYLGVLVSWDPSAMHGRDEGCRIAWAVRDFYVQMVTPGVVLCSMCWFGGLGASHSSRPHKQGPRAVLKCCCNLQAGPHPPLNPIPRSGPPPRQVDFGAEYDGLIPLNDEATWDALGNRLRVGSCVEARVHRVRDARLFRYPVQLAPVDPALQALLPRPESHMGPMDLRDVRM